LITLALDTTTRAGSLAIVDERGVRVARSGDPTRSHAERLPLDLMNALAAAGLGVRDVDVFAVAAGPGSFTGLRIGIATMQGLAFATGKRIVAVSALEALAEAAFVESGNSAGCIGVWMDAHRREVFAALYDVERIARQGTPLLRVVDDPSVGDPREVWSRWMRSDNVPDLVAGDGAALYRDVLSAAGVPAMDAPLMAPAIGRLALDRAARGEAIHPAAVQPLYIRRPDAEVARDAAQQARS
jgi:tRNA threonylcarbamoyladenosine biosynthesis protein TsaB